MAKIRTVGPRTEAAIRYVEGIAIPDGRGDEDVRVDHSRPIKRVKLDGPLPDCGTFDATETAWERIPQKWWIDRGDFSGTVRFRVRLSNETWTAWTSPVDANLRSDFADNLEDELESLNEVKQAIATGCTSKTGDRFELLIETFTFANTPIDIEVDANGDGDFELQRLFQWRNTDRVIRDIAVMVPALRDQETASGDIGVVVHVRGAGWGLVTLGKPSAADDETVDDESSCACLSPHLDAPVATTHCDPALLAWTFEDDAILKCVGCKSPGNLSTSRAVLEFDETNPDVYRSPDLQCDGDEYEYANETRWLLDLSAGLMPGQVELRLDHHTADIRFRNAYFWRCDGRNWMIPVKNDPGPDNDCEICPVCLSPFTVDCDELTDRFDRSTGEFIVERHRLSPVLEASLLGACGEHGPIELRYDAALQQYRATFSDALFRRLDVFLNPCNWSGRIEYELANDDPTLLAVGPNGQPMWPSVQLDANQIDYDPLFVSTSGTGAAAIADIFGQFAYSIDGGCGSNVCGIPPFTFGCIQLTLRVTE